MKLTGIVEEVQFTARYCFHLEFITSQFNGCKKVGNLEQDLISGLYDINF